MKKVLLVTLLGYILFVGNSFAMLISNTDLWDVSNGITIIDHSYLANGPGIYWDSYADNMFGATHEGTIEPPNTIFADNPASGFTHWVEWQTPTPITLTSFNLVAAHGSPSYTDRGFSEFRLYGSTDGSTWDNIYTYVTENPYGGGKNYTHSNQLELYVDLASPVTAQYFKAEFDQAGVGAYSGPRIMELDGYGSPVPIPGAAWLLGSGLVGLVAVRRCKV